MNEKGKILTQRNKTRHGPVAGQLTNPSSDEKEFDISNFNTNHPSNQLNDIPQLPPEAQVSEELGLDACHWLDRYVDFSRIWSPESFDGYHESCGISVLSTVAAGRVAFDLSGRRKTNLNIILVGRTSIHAKSTAADIAKDLLNEAGLDWLLAADETTPQKLIADMSSNVLPENFNKQSELEQSRSIYRTLTSGQRAWFVDEFGDKISAMMQKDGVMSGLKGLIRTLDGAPQKYEYSTISRDSNLIMNPYLPILGNITIADLAPYVKRGTTLLGDGFIARFATPTPPSDFLSFGKIPNQPRVFPRSLVSPLIDWNKLLGFPEYKIIENKGKQVLKFEPLPPEHLKISEETFEAFYEYHNALRIMIWKRQNQDLDGNYARFPEKALRIAALFACFGNSDTIELKHWAKAQAITERWRVGLHEMYAQVTCSHQDQSTRYINQLPIEDQIIRAISLKKIADKREVCQFTGLKADIVGPALGKLVSQNIIIVNNDNGRERFLMASQ